MADDSHIPYESFSPGGDRPLYKIKLVMLGGSGYAPYAFTLETKTSFRAGKTSLLIRFVNQSFQTETFATIGADMLRKELVLEESAVVVEAWDTAGQERFRSLGSTFYQGADLCCLVYDSTSTESFEDMKSWLQEFCFMMELGVGSDEFKSFPILVLANKIDLHVSDQVTLLNSEAFSIEY